MDADCNNKIKLEYSRAEMGKVADMEEDHMIGFGVVIVLIFILMISGAAFAFVRKTKNYSRARSTRNEEDGIEMDEVLLPSTSKSISKTKADIYRTKSDSQLTNKERVQKAANIRRTKAAHELREI